MVETEHVVTRVRAPIPLAGPANRQGRLVADNILGAKRPWKGAMGTAIVRVFDTVAACTGASEKTLRAFGRPVQPVLLFPQSHAGYYPGAKQMALKLCVDPSSRKLLGAQAVGPDGVDKRIDVLATAIRAGLTVDDIADLELCYAPPFGSAKDPVNLAGMIAQNILDGRVEVVSPSELTSLPEPFTLLDVRTPAETAQAVIPGAISIPLDELRERIGELPRDQLLVVYCASGQRSYQACRILTQRGFRARNLQGAWKGWDLEQQRLALAG